MYRYVIRSIFAPYDIIFKGDSLRGANLVKPNLQYAILMEVNLRGADLTGADLRGVDITGAKFT